MPEPNLPPLHIAMGSVKWGCVNADDLKSTLPELPQQTRSHLKDEYGLTMEQSVILVVILIVVAYSLKFLKSFIAE